MRTDSICYDDHDIPSQLNVSPGKVLSSPLAQAAWIVWWWWTHFALSYSEYRLLLLLLVMVVVGFSQGVQVCILNRC